MTPYLSIEKQIKRATFDDLVALYATKKSALDKTAARIFMNIHELSKDDSLEIAERYDELEDDCMALAAAIADLLIDPKQQTLKELAYA